MSGFSRTRDAPRSFELVGQGRAAPLNSIYVGFVKAVDDATYMGRLQVWIPELGGDPTDSNSWYTCSYASPFGGATSIYNVKTGGSTWPESQRSYGMWFVPPDLENEVVVCFINGDHGRGVWFGCLFQQNMNHMIPGIPGNNSGDTLPVVEYNKKSLAIGNNNGTSTPDNAQRPLFTPLSDQLKIQGLDQDLLRGVSTSGARRTDPPNSVFGILTPFQNQFVMDDNPGQAFIRLRTRSGAQVLISDSEGSIYINSNDGNNWFNMAADGSVEIYALGDISMRSQGSLNLRADIDVNIEAGRTINMKARNDTNVPNPSQPSMDRQANGGNININANQNFNLTTSNIYTYASNTHTRTAGNIFDTADGPPLDSSGMKSKWGNIYVKANGNIFINSNSNIAIQSIDNIFIETSNLIYMDAANSIIMSSGDNISILAHDNIIVQTSANLYVTAASNSYITTLGNSCVTTFGDSNIVINNNAYTYTGGTTQNYYEKTVTSVANQSIWITSNHQISILAEQDDIIIATGNDLWCSALGNIFLASEIDMVIHTGGYKAEYIHTDKKTQKIQTTKEDIIVPDIDPLAVEVDPYSPLNLTPPDLMQEVKFNMWAVPGQLPIYPTDLTQVDKQIDGVGNYSQVTRQTILYRLPYHEPYAYHSGGIVGTDTYIGQSGGQATDPYTGLPLQLGTIVGNANFPMPIYGTPRSGMQPGLWVGTGYDGTTPLYALQGPLPSSGGGSLSAAGIQFLISYEGLNPLPYTDQGGAILIGVGHALTGDEISNQYTNVDGQQIPWQQGLTDDQIMSLLNMDLYEQGDQLKQKPVVPTVQQAVTKPITQAQFDMLVDFCFNIGPQQFESCDVVQSIKQGNYDLATQQWMTWNTLNGSYNQSIQNRRAAEVTHFRGLYASL